MNKKEVQDICDEYDYPPSVIITNGKTFECDVNGVVS